MFVYEYNRTLCRKLLVMLLKLVLFPFFSLLPLFSFPQFFANQNQLPIQTENTCPNFFHTTKLLSMHTDNISNALKSAFIKVFIYI